MAFAEKLQSPKIRIVAGLLLVIAALLTAWAGWWLGFGSGAKQAGAPAVYTVKPGPLAITVAETGTIKAREQVVIKNEVAGKTSILWIIEEGTRVVEGELLIELDASNLEDNLVDQEIKLQNSEAAWIRVRENMDVVRNQAQSDEEKAELELDFARQDLAKYIEGEHPRELKEAEAKIILAAEELRRAEEKLKWSAALYAEQYISQSEVQADELAAKKARLDLELREADLDLLQRYTHGRRLAELESKGKQAEMALERTRRKANADVIQADADLRAKSSEFERERGKRDRISAQIARTKIRAPADGLVIYATTAQGGSRGSADPLAAGQDVKERQELIYLPKTTSVLAEVKLHESNLDKVRVGLTAAVTVDALPGRVFQGKVASIAPLPDAQSIWLNPDLKLYTTVIHLDGDGSELRTGMSCLVEIMIERYNDVLFVPLQALRREGSQQIVYRRRGLFTGGSADFHPVTVKVGLDNNSMVRVLEGITAGDTVLLAPPFTEEGTEK